VLLNAASLINRIAATKLSALPRWRAKKKRPGGNAIRTNRRQAMIAVKRATILLRFDWLTGLIGALL
jgi:hypothetical protein